MGVFADFLFHRISLFRAAWGRGSLALARKRFAQSKARERSRRLGIEALERRQLLSTLPLVAASPTQIGAGENVTVAAGMPPDATGKIGFFDNGNFLGKVPLSDGTPQSALEIDDWGSYVSIPNMDMSNFAFDAWVKLDSLGSSQQILIASQNTGGWGLGLNATGAPTDALWFSDIGVSNVNDVASIPDTGWHNIGVDFASAEGSAPATVSFYIDGHLDVTEPYVDGSFVPDSDDGGYCIGSAGGQFPASAAEADVEIYGRTLSATDFSTLFDNGSGLLAQTTLPDPVAVYTFNDTTADTLDDNLDGTLVGSANWPVALNTVSLPVSDLPAGLNQITVKYKPVTGSNYAASTSNTVAVDVQGSSSTSLSASMDSVDGSLSTTLTATVTGTDANNDAPSGNVKFYDNGNELVGNIAQSSSPGSTTYVLVTPNVSPGDTISAQYGGDSNFAGSTSNNVVAQAPTTLALTSSDDPEDSIAYGQTVTFTATLTAPDGGSVAGAENETVQFLSGSNLLGTGTLEGNGVATFATDQLPVGTVDVTAVYAGDSEFQGSTSSASNQTVVGTTLDWDPSSSRGTNLGGNGSWNPTTICWYDPAAGQDVAWTDGNYADFAGTAGTVTIYGSVSPASIEFETSGYDLEGAGYGGPAGSIVLPSPGTSIDVTSGDTATIDATISGSGTLATTGTGTLYVTAVNNYGDTEVNAGVVDFANGALGSGSISFGGGTLQWAPGNTQDISGQIASGQSAILDLNGNSVDFGGFSNCDVTIIDSSGGARTAQIDNSNVGTLTVDGGTVQVESSSIGAFIVNGGSLTLLGGNWSSGGNVLIEDNGTLTVASDAWYGGNPVELGNTTISDGTLDLDGNCLQIESLTGTNVTIVDSSGGNGILQLGSNSAVDALNMNGGTLDLNGADLSVNGPLNGSGGTITNNGGSPSTMTVNDPDDDTMNFAGTLQDGTNPLRLVATIGNGSLTLSGANNYSGGTDLESGSLVLGNSNALGTGGVTVNGGTLDLNGQALQFGSLTGSNVTVADSGGAGTAQIISGNIGTLTVDGGDVQLNNCDIETLIVNGGSAESSENSIPTVTVMGGNLTLLCWESSFDQVTVSVGTLTVTSPSGYPAYLGNTALASGTLDLEGPCNVSSLNQTGGTLQLDSNSTVGNLNMGGGTVNLNGNYLQATSLTGADATIVDSSGGNGTLQLGSNSAVDTLNMGGGTLDLDGNCLHAGLLTGSNVTIVDSSSNSSGTAQIGGGNVSTLTVGGGDVTVSGANFSAAEATVSSGRLLIDGANCNLGAITVTGGTLDDEAEANGSLTWTGGSVVGPNLNSYSISAPTTTTSDMQAFTIDVSATGLWETPESTNYGAERNSWKILWSDGSESSGYGSPPSSLTHYYCAPGTYTVTTQSGSGSETVNVTSCISLAGDSSTAEGVPYTIDPRVYIDSSIAYGWTIVWGDGSSTTSGLYDPIWNYEGWLPSSITHVYAPTQDNYTVTVTATVLSDSGPTYDETSNPTFTESAQIPVEIQAPPSFTANGPSALVEGDSYTLTSHGTWTANDTWSISWSYGSSSVTGVGDPPTDDLTHVYGYGGGQSELTATVYDPTTGYSSTFTQEVTVTPATTTTLTSNADTSTYGQAVEFSASVAALDSNIGTPTGTVEFCEDGKVLDTENLDGAGTAKFTTASLPAGSHSLSAIYSGDSEFAGSISTIYSQQVVVSPVGISGATKVDVGMPYTLALAAADTLTAAITGWTVNWGDGSIQSISGNPSTVEHFYSAAAAPRTITASATDGVNTYDATVTEGVAGAEDTGFSFANPAASCYGLNAMAVEPDGKIVAAGPGPSGSVFIARYNVDGTLDVQFAPSGLTTVTAVAVEPMDDRSFDLLVAGMTPGGFSLVRYNSDGTLDNSFSAGPTSSLFDGNSFKPCQIAVQSSGGIVLAGSVSGSGTTDLGMVRFNSDGSLDSTFGDAGGWLTAGVSACIDDPCALALGADDSIALAGTVITGQQWIGNQYVDCLEFAILRYDSSGNLQTDFGNNGLLLDNLGNSGLDDHLTAVAIEADGSLVAAGYRDDVSSPLDLVQYLADGSRDASFGNDGVVTGAPSSLLSAYALTVQADGKILVGGVGSADSSFAIARFNADGALDSSFGSGGMVSHEFGSLDSKINSLAIEPDGRIVAAGLAGTQIHSDSASNEAELVRYMPGDVGSLSVIVDNASPPLPVSGNDPAATAGTVAAGDTFYLSLGNGSANFGSGSDIQYVINWGDNVSTTFTADQLNALGGQVTHVYAGYAGESTTPTITVDLVDGTDPPYQVGSMNVSLDLSSATATSLTSSATSVSYGQTIMLTARVSALGTQFIYPTGSVAFYDGTTCLGTSSLNYLGATSMQVSSLPVGDQEIVGVYSGDDTFNPSISSLFGLSVTEPASPPVITLSGPPSINEGQGYPLTLSASAATYPITQWTIYWGDGNSTSVFDPTNPVTTSYAFANDSGNYVIRAVATDSQGNQYSAVLDADSAGSLDGSFGNGPVTGDQGALTGVAVQPDGSIVAASSDGSLVRYDSSGNPDGTSFDSSIDGIGAVALQPLGASFGIIVAGSGFSVARYNSDGSLDATFGDDGTASIAALDGTPSQIFVQPDGEIVLVGFVPDGNNGADLTVARFTASGMPDTSFGPGGDGYVMQDFASMPASCSAALQSGNRVVVAVDCGNGTVELLRFTAAGLLDDSTNDTTGTPFGSSGAGMLTASVIDGDPAIGVAQDDSIFLAGGTAAGNFSLLKYLPDGQSLDGSFGAGGVVSGPFSEVAALSIEPSGRIIVAGVNTTSADEWAIASFEPGGALDTNFGAGGAIDGQVAGDPYAMALQPDGQIVVAGDYIDPSSGDAFATIARYNASLAVQVSDVEPTGLSASISAAGGCYSTGDGTRLNGSFTDPVSRASRAVTIDWGDGTADNPDTTTLTLNPGQTTFSVPAQQYAASGQYIITVSVGDAAGSTPAVTIPVTYTDLAPTQLVASMAGPVITNQEAELSGTFTDSDATQAHTVTIDWDDGDGSPDTTILNLGAGITSFSAPHIYSGDGSYAVSVTVANSYGSTQQTTMVGVLDTAPTTGLAVASFTADDSGNLSVAYTVSGAAATPFTIGVYSSVDGVQLGAMVQSVDVSDPELLTVGAHLVTFAVQAGALSGGEYYVADLDVYDQVAETTRADNESAPLAGVFQASDGSVYVFTPSMCTNDSVNVVNGSAGGSLNVTVNSTLYTFQNVSYVYATTYGSGDTVTVDPQMQVPSTVFNGAEQSVEVGFFLSAAQTGRTELDIQAAIDAVHGGTGGATLQLDAVQGAGQMEVWDSADGGNQIPIGTNGAIESWGFSSTGQIDQLVWFSGSPGASDGQIVLKIAAEGTGGNAANVNAQVSAPANINTPNLQITFDPGSSTLSASCGSISPATLPGTVKSVFDDTIGNTQKSEVYVRQSVSGHGWLTVKLKPDSGTSGGTDGSGSDDASPTSLEFVFGEYFQEAWESNDVDDPYNFTDSHQPKNLADAVERLCKFSEQDGKLFLTRQNQRLQVVSWEFTFDVGFSIQRCVFPSSSIMMSSTYKPFYTGPDTKTPTDIPNLLYTGSSTTTILAKAKNALFTSSPSNAGPYYMDTDTWTASWKEGQSTLPALQLKSSGYGTTWT